MEKPRNFRNYKVWQDAVNLATEIYRVTGTLPWFEKKGLCDQLQRAAVSIASNIAEGSGRTSNADFAHFLEMGLGSAYEVETQILVSKNVGYIQQELYDTIQNQLIDIEKQLIAFIKLLRTK